jgi:pseudoazurin
MKKILLSLCLAASTVVVAQTAFAAEIEVRMLNKGSNGEAMVFEPAAIKAEVGDTIRFVPTDRGHDAVAIKELIPEGAEVFRGKINQVVSVTLDQAGVYVVKCSPHFGMGMVATIVVGEASESELAAVSAAKMPKKAKERVAAQLVELTK